MKISQVTSELARLLYASDFDAIIGGVSALSAVLQIEGIQPDDPIDVKVQRWISDPQAFPLEQHELASYVGNLQASVATLQTQVTTLQATTVAATPTTSLTGP